MKRKLKMKGLILPGNYYRFNNIPATAEADLQAIESDFAAISEDFWVTVNNNPKEKLALAK